MTARTQEPRLKWIEIDLGAVRENLRWVRSRLERGARLMAVVKANAYGHGAAEVAKVAAAEGASCLGVLSVEEAVELRAAAVRAPIVLLSPPLPTQAAQVARLGLEPTVDSEEGLRALERAARRRIPVHLDIDFGLKRWGASPAAAEGLAARVKRSRRLTLAGISTHLDYVPGKNGVEAEAKLRLFQRLAARVKAKNPDVLCHAANSSIFMDFPRWQMDMVRVGNLLYGINPASAEARLRSPWTCYARIIALSEVGKGRAIGYASEYVAPRKMTVATLPAGYADGLTMEPAERLIGFGSGYQYWGWLRGKKTPFVGRCAIAHVLVDVSKVARPRLGDAVSLPLRRTGASARIPRVYKDGAR
ncbi:MAG: alanine racemase [Elusimicrobia bacterium]|nr:alanine racemase [Elusimicrobiota bacterium]